MKRFVKRMTGPGSGKSLRFRTAHVALAILLMFALMCSSSLAEKKDKWVYDGDAKADADVWAALSSTDEAFYDGITYEPIMYLGSNDAMEAWLVKYGTLPEESSEELQTEGYLVMYIQFSPLPKVIAALPAGAAPAKTEPTCEIKFLLDTDLVLNEDHLLEESIREEFQTGETYESIGAIYLDTPARDYLNAGWINRIRVKEGKNKYTITYKKRYPVQDDDMEAALAAARDDGFSLYDEQFLAQADWGYSKMTLSFDADEDVKTEETPDLTLLTRDEAVRMLAEKMPSELKNWSSAGWGTEKLDEVQVIGPILFLRYSGIDDDQKIRIEIWPVSAENGMQYIIELSAECKNLKQAAELRDILREKLDEMGILIHDDGLKTEMILNGLGRAE